MRQEVLHTFNDKINKHSSCQNLFCNYVSLKRVFYTKTDIMNSFEKVKITNNVKSRKIKFSYTIEGTNITADKELIALEDLELDLELWIEDFRHSVSLCHWEEGTAISVLKALLSCTLYKLIDSKRTLDTMLDELLRLKYPKENGMKYLKLARSQKQKNFNKTTDFYLKLKENLQKASIALAYSKKEQEERLEEFFWENLCPEVQNEIIKNGWSGSKTILENIKRLEEHLIQQKNDVREDTWIPKNHSNKKEYFPEKVNFEQRKHQEKKWCSFHKVSTHGNSDCFVQKKNKKNQSKTINE
jgi:hypothetical protein